MSRLLWICLIICCAAGCVHHTFVEKPVWRNNKPVSEQSDASQSPITTPTANNEPTTAELLKQLTAVSFLDHTLAARRLVELGPTILTTLYHARHLMRESNDTLIPCVLVVIRIIFSQQSEVWVQSQLHSDKPEFRKLAETELERRAKEREAKGK